MATPREVLATLRSMSEAEIEAINDVFPFEGQARSPEGYERLFYDQPGLEAPYCRLLRLPSESNKMTEAELDSAEAPKVSALAARNSAFWAKVASLASLV